MSAKFLGAMLAAVAILSSCVSLKEEYPDIRYYELSQEPLALDIGIGKIDGALAIRDFTSTDEVDTDRFLVLKSGSKNEIKPYYYYRWISSVPELLTDFFLVRYNLYGAFSKGAVKMGSVTEPDYVLEGDVLDMKAINREEEDSCSVTIVARLTLAKREVGSPRRKIIFNKVYKMERFRKGPEATTIAPAFSSVISEIADKALLEIYGEIQKDIRGK